jgi:hypothetical protein
MKTLQIRRKFAISLVMAMMLIMAISAVSLAAGPNNPDAGTGVGPGAELQGDWVDVDGDGICDNFVEREPAGDGTGNQYQFNGKQFLNQGQGQGQAIQKRQGIHEPGTGGGMVQRGRAGR